MKRDSFNDDGPRSQKRQRQNEDEVTLLIPSKVAGSIIGKGGTNISKLRSQYKASITVPDCPGPERVLSISAYDMDTVLCVVKDVMPHLADGGSKMGNDELDVRLLIHQSQAGCIIGKAGAKIKELRDKTGARLKVFSNPAPQSTERVVQMVGKCDSVADAIREVLELTKKTPIKGIIENYDPHNYDDYFAEEYGGFGGSQGGQGGRGGPRGGGGPMRSGGGAPPRGGPPMGPSGRGPPPMRGGPPLGRNGPGGGPRGGGFNDFGGPAPRDNFSAPPRGLGSSFGGSFGGRGSGGGGGGGGGGFNNNNQQGETSTQVTIPKDLAGAIIGKAGSRIRNIRAESGAGIEIAEPLGGSNERIITITGTNHQIQMAQYLLQQSVHESHPSLGRGNF